MGFNDSSFLQWQDITSVGPAFFVKEDGLLIPEDGRQRISVLFVVRLSLGESKYNSFSLLLPYEQVLQAFQGRHL